MKLLVDCTTLRHGGSVQVAIALLHGLRRRDDVDWLAIVPEYLSATLEADNLGDGRDPPPMNWSILRYVFGHQEEDHKCRESITSPRR